MEIILSEWACPAFASMLQGRKVFFVCSFPSISKVLHEPSSGQEMSDSIVDCVCLFSDDDVNSRHVYIEVDLLMELCLFDVNHCQMELMCLTPPTMVDVCLLVLKWIAIHA